MRLANWLAGVMALCALPVYSGDWNAQRAAEYLDSRQQEWFAWPAAKAVGGPCFSCHTSMTYLMARPGLRRKLGESGPTPFETRWLDTFRSRVAKRQALEIYGRFAKEPLASQSLGVEAIFAALFLSAADAESGVLSAGAETALQRMWALQTEGAKGSWDWFSVNLDPWEMPESRFYGAALAAMAVASTPTSYRVRPDVKANTAKLVEYLRREQASQPLHNRLMLLWSASRLPDALAKDGRKAIVADAWRQQQVDGGWTLSSLGPWSPHADAPPAATGSNGYATAFATFALEQAGTSTSDAKLAKALGWLRTHQDREAGTWAADSMNKRYEPGSMEIRFMQDAATAFAAMALLGTGNH